MQRLNGKMKFRFNNNNGGALLFAIIASFVLALIGATLVLLTMNQYRVINNEIQRTVAHAYVQAGVEYAIYEAYSDPANLPTDFVGDSDPYTITVNGQVININIVNLGPGGISEYQITVNTTY